MSAYDEGKKAFAAGESRFQNPYYNEHLRNDWDDGWLDAYYSYEGCY